MRNRLALLVPLLVVAAGCETTNSDDWSGGASTPFRNAEKSCLTQTQSIANEANRRDFFVGCMAALGWTPRAGASIDL